ncbi:unnamed protein product [Cladocopium goreaui]|uniref:Uncharacterized protein n=1 Tax=Cladocopium goreaui TaxID=2562237 RepID=A0A9P1CQJ8_9DINO|nr:unnamed protein product [Cladocopium goreaui]
MAGHDESLSLLWERVTAEVDDLVAKRQRGISSVEDFAVDRVCAGLEKLRQQANYGNLDSDQGPITLRSVIAMEEHRCRVLQEMIDEARTSLERAEESREELQKELGQVTQNTPSLTSGRSAVQRHLQEIQAEIAQTQDEVRQLEGDTAALAAERQRVEHLINEANQRKAIGDAGGSGGSGGVAGARGSNGTGKEEPASAISGGNSASATAAFLNSSLGQGLGPGKLDLSNGSVHSAGMHFLASHRSVDETQTTAEVGSVASCSTQGYAANCNVFDTIQERLALLREKCVDPGAGPSRAPVSPDGLDISTGRPQAKVLTEAQTVLQKMEIIGHLRHALN